MILRYDLEQIVYSRLNPIEDIMLWVAGLRSQGYVADLLKDTHGFSNKNKINKSAKAIACHAEHAVNLMNQGYSGPPDVCFLPIYYAMLDLSKIQIILSGKLDDLKQQRFHGAAYNPTQKKSRDLLTEEITLHSKGAIPLYYQSLTGQRLAKVILAMKDIYRFIRNTSYEFSEIYNEENVFNEIEINVEGDESNGFRLKATLSQDVRIKNIKQIRVLKGFTLEPATQKNPDGTAVHNLTGYNNFYTATLKGIKSEEAQSKLINKYLNRYLLSVDFDSNGAVKTLTPIVDKKIVFPEEIPILLSFYHMSNVVRYNPEMLDKLKDSKAWSLLLVLPRHGVLTFLELIWSSIMKKHFKICMD